MEPELDGEIIFENAQLKIGEKRYACELVTDNRSHIEYIHKSHQKNLNSSLLELSTVLKTLQKKDRSLWQFIRKTNLKSDIKTIPQKSKPEINATMQSKSW